MLVAPKGLVVQIGLIALEGLVVEIGMVALDTALSLPANHQVLVEEMGLIVLDTAVLLQESSQVLVEGTRVVAPMAGRQVPVEGFAHCGVLYTAVSLPASREVVACLVLIALIVGDVVCQKVMNLVGMVLCWPLNIANFECYFYTTQKGPLRQNLS